jgi:hypothetical protein
MAHFAKIGIDNTVLEVLVVNNVDCMTPQGEEREEIGVEFLKKLTGHEVWKQTSYNGSFRKRYAGHGYTYNSELDAFIPPKPYASWTLDTETAAWNPPTPMPTTEGKIYTWNESTLSWDESDYTPPV